MEMVKLESVKDWETLSLNKDHIKQPLFSQKRENALETGIDGYYVCCWVYCFTINYHILCQFTNPYLTKECNIICYIST